MLLKYFPPKNKHGNESTDVGQPANLYNTTEGVRKWMRELNKKDENGKDMDVVFRRLYHWIKAHRQVCYKIFNFFPGGYPPLPRKNLHIEKYYPFPRYKIKPTNDSEYTRAPDNFQVQRVITPYF